MNAPVAIGGVGGSGTRLAAQMLTALGYDLGSDLNQAGDNLWYSFLFVRKDILSLSHSELEARARLFVDAMAGGGRISADASEILRALRERTVQHGPMRSPSWLRERAARLEASLRRSTHHQVRWGWKEPNTHLLLDRWVALLPQMRYIHVVRNGLDMAFSHNQNQASLWGTSLLGLPSETIDPAQSLKYWCYVHRRVLEIGATMGRRFLFLRYEALCTNPSDEIAALCRFLGRDFDSERLESLASLVDFPSSIGRYKAHGLDSLDPADVEFVSRLGFETL